MSRELTITFTEEQFQQVEAMAKALRAEPTEIVQASTLDEIEFIAENPHEKEWFLFEAIRKYVDRKEVV